MSVIGSNILAGASGHGGYFIDRSVRLRSSASAYFNRTNASSPTNAIKWTWSGWVKRGSLGAKQNLVGATNSGSDDTYFNFNSSDQIVLGSYTGAGTDYGIKTSAVFRDPCAWYHVVAVLDTANATSADRAIIYVNGVRQTVTNSANGMWPQNATNNKINTASQVVNIGRRSLGDSYLDGYLTEINFIDGQALTPSDFGEYDADTGVWKPKKYVGTYGANGFYLNFSDNTSTTTLGYDYSGNGNNWTANNISLTSGVTYDSMTDVPTLTSETTANYAVLNPLDTGSYLTIQNGNMRVYGNTASNSAVVRGTIGANQGKFYWETTITTAGGISYAGMGIDPAQINAEQYWISSGYTKGCGRRNGGGALYSGYGGYGAVSGITATSFTSGDVIGVAVDFDNGALYYSKNGTWENSGDPTSGASKTGAFNVWTAGAITGFPAAGGYNGSVNDLNCGQRPFAYTPPTGFKALNTFNLPDSTIVDGSQHFDVSLYTGNATARSITGVGFQPDFVWSKSRSGAESHRLYDAVRGATQSLYSNLTNAETTEAQSLTAFNSDGFSLGTGAPNSNAVTYAAWQWKANGAGVSNTAGSITSTVSANTTAGFSICTFTSGSPGTVGHGLGTAPSMIILKSRNNVSGWSVYHSSVGNTGALNLQATSAVSTSADWWSNTSPTSSVFSIGANIINGWTWVGHCFAEVPGFSKFGSYTGNGSADGPFVYCGFRPKFVLFKAATGTTYNWAMYDSSRDTYNICGAQLAANSSAAEGTYQNVDFLSNGFKVRGNNNINESGATMIYAAFAENPFKNSLAR